MVIEKGECLCHKINLPKDLNYNNYLRLITVTTVSTYGIYIRMKILAWLLIFISIASAVPPEEILFNDSPNSVTINSTIYMQDSETRAEILAFLDTFGEKIRDLRKAFNNFHDKKTKTLISSLRKKRRENENKIQEVQHFPTSLEEKILDKNTDFGVYLVQGSPETLPDIPGFSKYPNLPIQINSLGKLEKIKAERAYSSVVPPNAPSICIVDTGVESSHPVFDCPSLPCPKIKAARSFVPREDPLRDLNGHGTHVAAIAAGFPFESFAGGVEPRASLIVAQVLNRDGGGDMFSLIQGIDFCLDPLRQGNFRNKASIINLSLGSSYLLKSYNPNLAPLIRALNTAATAKVFIAKAAGNDRANKAARTGTEFDSMDGMALLPGVMSVGAADRSGSLESYSSVGPETWQTSLDSVNVKTGPDLIAHGTHCSARSTYGFITSPCTPNNPWLALASGTSMATPIVSGAAAKLLFLRPSLSGAEIKEILRQTTDKPRTPDPVRVGAGNLNINRAVQNVNKRFPIIDNSIPVEVLVNRSMLNKNNIEITITGVRLKAVIESASHIVHYDLFVRDGNSWRFLRRRHVSGLKINTNDLISVSDLRGSQPLKTNYTLKLVALNQSYVSSEILFHVTTKDYLPPYVSDRFYLRPILYSGVLCGRVTMGLQEPYFDNFKYPIRGETMLVRGGSPVDPKEIWRFTGNTGLVEIDLDRRRQDLNYLRTFSFHNRFFDDQGNLTTINLHTGMTYRDWCANGPPPTPTPLPCTPPIITSHPVGGFFDPGERLELSVGVDETTLLQRPEYRWYRYDTELPDRGPAYVRVFDARQSGDYRVKVILPCGEALSNIAEVRIRPVP